jgi:hypothetical protein
MFGTQIDAGPASTGVSRIAAGIIGRIPSRATPNPLFRLGNAFFDRPALALGAARP